MSAIYIQFIEYKQIGGAICHLVDFLVQEFWFDFGASILGFKKNP